MKRRIGKKNWMVFAFDIESHNCIESIVKNETSMWLGCIIDENSKVDQENSYVYSMDEFIEWLDKNSSKPRDKKKTRPCNNLLIYIYNLSFEWSFILPKLIELGYTWNPSIQDIDEKCYNSISTKTCSSVWEVNLKIGAKNGLICFRDMAKIFSGGLGKVAAAFKLPTQKGEIDYRKCRLRKKAESMLYEQYVLEHPDVYNHKGLDTHMQICEAVGIDPFPKYHYKPTAKEKEYCFKDTKILMDILQRLDQDNDKTFFSVISMASYSMKKLIEFGYGRCMKPYTEYRKSYPELDAAQNAFLRKGVEGGLCYATPRYQFVDIKQPILHIDAHQMHPSSAFLHSYPYGNGEYFVGEPTEYFRYIHCCRIRISYDYAELHSIIKLIPFDTIANAEIVVWDFEIPTMKKIYKNLKIEYIDGYKYHQRVLPWRKYYLFNFTERLKSKEAHDDYNVLRYKLLNNSSYGKLLEKPHNESYENIVDDNECINSNIIPNDEEKISAKYTYLPVGSAIPAYSRVALIETALKFGIENLIYFDTDSIFALYNKHTKQVWEELINQKNELGGWGLEEISKRGQFAAPKRYKLEIDQKAIIKAAGINFKLHIDAMKSNNPDYEVAYDEINIISSKWKIQRGFRCKGGTLIDFQIKEMTVQKKYQKILEYNSKRDII